MTLDHAGKEETLPWKDTSPVTERKKFIEDYLTGEFTVTELCRKYGISRKTGHKWIRRFLDHCELTDRSSRPHRSPKAVPSWVEDAIVRARRQKPRWGPRKLRDALLRANPGAEMPSVSTFALIFRRNGLIRPKRRRRKAPPFSAPLAHAKAPNQVWCIDFKGHFAVGTTRCHPLTITDAFSRFLIACVALSRPDGQRVRKVMEQVFDEFGLPDAIRSDNGTPFASNGLGGLSEVSTWWWKLGIRHERIQPGKPQQNGRHERMHLTLAQETASPPSANLKAQQRAFDRFRKEYNHDRPHEALGGNVPADYYQPSERPLPDPPWGRDFLYPDEFEIAQVSKLGYLQWNGRSAYVSSALAHQKLGLDWEDRRTWKVYFGRMLLGTLRRGPRGALRFTATTASPTSMQ
ncbi:MAG TPA: DDE-type integrase/transposase/recombinase [Burkholderiales bacterium]|nr:DDE-type integrase/transposase/recombinase [Burkholderiales bacterium]